MIIQRIKRSYTNGTFKIHLCHKNPNTSKAVFYFISPNWSFTVALPLYLLLCSQTRCKKLLASLLRVKSFCSPLNFCFKDCVQLNFQSSTLCVSDNSSQSSGFPHLRRYSCPPSTAHDPQEQNLKSCTVQLSITSLHFLHRIIFLTIFIMHVTRSQSSAFISFFEPQIIFFKALIADIHNM